MDEYENYKLEETQKAEFKVDDGMVIESVSDENSESVKETHEGDESTPDQRSIQVVDSEELEDRVVLDSVIEPEPSIDSAEPVVSSSEELAQVTIDPVENLGASDVTEVETKDIQEKIIQLVDENNGVSSVVEDTVSKEIDSFSVENGISPIVTNSISNGIEPSLDENNVVSSVVMDSVKKGIEETTLPASDGNIGESSGSVALLSKENASNMLPASDGNIGESSDSVALFSKENASNMLQSGHVRSADAENGGENCNMSEVPKSTENQPFIAVTPRLLQRTSWSGCCGLFEILRRSNQ